MKKLLLLFLLLPVILFVTLAGCENGTIQIGDFLTITVNTDGVEITEDGVLDFGILRPGEDSLEISLTATNNGEEDIVVGTVDKTGSEAFVLTIGELPVTIPAGETLQYSLTFAPAESGAETGTLTLTAVNFPDAIEIELTGEGNYAPVPLFGVTVSNAGTEGVNGFYERDGFQDTGSEGDRPKYTKEGTPTYYIFGYSPDGMVWIIEDEIPRVNEEYYNSGYEMVPQPTGWAVDNGTEPAPDLEVHDIYGVYAYYGEDLTANYLYFDEEGDTEETDAVAYRWFRADAVDGTYTAISDATQKKYTPVPADEGKYLKVGITVQATAGYTDGEEVLSSATIQIAMPPS